MSIYTYLTEMLMNEKRKHGPEWYKPLKQVIEEYKNRPDADDIYIHFSNDFFDSKSQLINQIGLNMKQNYDNPFGIYAYPIEHQSKFKASAPYAYIIKSRNKPRWIWNIADMSVPEFKRCRQIIKDEIFNGNEEEMITFQKETEELSDNKSYGGVLFYMIVRLSQKKKYNPNQKTNVFQTKVWRKMLGYSGLGDRGEGIIHPSEPYQAVWFNSSGFDIIDVVKNINYEHRSISRALEYGNTNDLENAIKLGAKPDYHDINDIIEKNDIDLLKKLLKMGAPINNRPESINNTLSLAAKTGNLDIVNTIIDAGGIPGDSYSNNTLNYAIVGGNPDVLRRILEIGGVGNENTIMSLLMKRRFDMIDDVLNHMYETNNSVAMNDYIKQINNYAETYPEYNDIAKAITDKYNKLLKLERKPIKKRNVINKKEK